MSDLYKQDGVDTKAGDDFSRFAAKLCRSTWKNSPFIKIHDHAAHNFRGPRSLEVINMPVGVRFDFGPDGIGTKVIIHEEAGSPFFAPRDLLAMGGGDLTRWGSLPVAFSNVLGVEKLGEPGSNTNTYFRELLTGLKEAADEQGIVLYRGETAEEGPVVGSENPDAPVKFSWAGFAIGLEHPHYVITGAEMKPRDIVIAMQEESAGSNGISTVRKALAMKFGTRWWENPNATQAIYEASLPCTLYDKCFAEVNGWTNADFEPEIRVKAIAHISGGGIPDKFAKDLLFPLGLSAELEDLYDPPPIMQKCAEWRGMSSRECYKTWHGGQRKLVVVAPEDVSRFVHLAARHNLKAKPCGPILRIHDPKLIIYSKFEPEALTWTPKDVS